MTISSPVSDVTYAGTNTTAVYAFTWQIAQASELVVETSVPATGVITPLVLGVDYTVSGVGIQTGGTITLTAGNLPIGTSLFICSEPAEVQDLLLTQNGPMDPVAVMAALDYLTRCVQATRRVANNALRFPLVESLSGLNSTLPCAAQRASLYPVFDPFGNITVTGANPAVSFQASVLNVSALKNLVAPVAGTVYATNGYYTAGDGGGATYFWNAADSRTDNGGSIIQLTAGGVGRFNLIYSYSINVLWFGAHGNGATNDDTPIANAIAALPANGGRLYFPNTGSSYITSATINVSALTGCVIEGDSRNGTQIVNSTNGVNIITCGQQNVVRRLSITAAGTGVLGCVYVHSANNCTVEECDFVNAGGSAVYNPSSGNSSGLSVVNCFFNGCATGVNSSGNMTSVISCIFVTCTVGINYAQSTGCLMMGCNFTGSVTNDITLSFTSGGVSIISCKLTGTGISSTGTGSFVVKSSPGPINCNSYTPTQCDLVGTGQTVSNLANGGGNRSSFLTTTGTLTYTSIAANTTQVQTMALAGAIAGDRVVATPVSDPGAAFVWSAGCYANGTITVRMANVTVGAQTPAAVTWQVSAEH